MRGRAPADTGAAVRIGTSCTIRGCKNGVGRRLVVRVFCRSRRLLCRIVGFAPPFFRSLLQLQLLLRGFLGLHLRDKALFSAAHRVYSVPQLVGLLQGTHARGIQLLDGVHGPVTVGQQVHLLQRRQVVPPVDGSQPLALVVRRVDGAVRCKPALCRRGSTRRRHHEYLPVVRHRHATEQPSAATVRIRNTPGKRRALVAGRHDWLVNAAGQRHVRVGGHVRTSKVGGDWRSCSGSWGCCGRWCRRRRG